MNKIQNFIDNPNRMTLNAVSQAKAKSLNFLAEDYSYPIECANFWDFIFKSPVHLSLFVDSLKKSKDLNIYGNITFNKNYKSTFDSLDDFNPLLFSLDQNRFLFLANYHYMTDILKDETGSNISHNLREEITALWNSSLEDKSVIQKFYEENKNAPDTAEYASLLADKFSILYESNYQDNFRIALLLNMNCIFVNLSLKNKIAFADVIIKKDFYDLEFRRDMIVILDKYGLQTLSAHETDTPQMPYNKDMNYTEKAMLFFKNLNYCKIMKNNRSHVANIEKFHLSQNIFVQKSNKVVKL